jgi:hypothetical protein
MKYFICVLVLVSFPLAVLVIHKMQPQPEYQGHTVDDWIKRASDYDQDTRYQAYDALHHSGWDYTYRNIIPQDVQEGLKIYEEEILHPTVERSIRRIESQPLDQIIIPKFIMPKSD